MKSYEYIDPYDLDEGLVKGNPEGGIDPEITDEKALELWRTVMRTVKNEKGDVVLKSADTVSQVFSRKVTDILNDEEHMNRKFPGKRPTVREIYTAAKFSKSKWGRMTGGDLCDLERGNVFAAAVALRLDEKQTVELLYSAGFALNYELDLDAAIMYFIKQEIYDLDYIYSVLSHFSDITNGLDCFMFQPKKKQQD